MAKLTLPSSVGAMWLLIALFGLCLVQPIDCLQDDEELFEKLSGMEVELVEVSLEQVEDADNVGLRGNSVAKLLKLRDSESDCGLEVLGKDYRDIAVYWTKRNYNKGLQEFCQLYLTERLVACADELEEELNLAVEEQLEPTQVAFLEGLSKEMSRVDIEGADDDENLISIEEFVDRFKPSDGEIDELKDSCESLAIVLEQVLGTTRVWYGFELEEKPFWIEVNHACNAVVNEVFGDAYVYIDY